MTETRPAKRRNSLVVAADLKEVKKTVHRAKLAAVQKDKAVEKRTERIKLLEKRIHSMKGNIYLVQKANNVKAKKIGLLNAQIRKLKKGYFSVIDIRDKVEQVYTSKINVFKADLLTACTFFDVNFYKEVFKSEEYTANEIFLLLLLKKHGWMVPKDVIKLGISEGIFKRVLLKFVKNELAFVHQREDIQIKTYTITKKGEDVVAGFEKKFIKAKSKL